MHVIKMPIISRHVIYPLHMTGGQTGQRNSAFYHHLHKQKYSERVDLKIIIGYN